MNFDVFFKAISTITTVDLPSTAAHIKMAPLERIKMLENGFDHQEDPRKAAVMMLFYPKKRNNSFVTNSSESILEYILLKLHSQAVKWKILI